MYVRASTLTSEPNLNVVTVAAHKRDTVRLRLPAKSQVDSRALSPQNQIASLFEVKARDTLCLNHLVANPNGPI